MRHNGGIDGYTKQYMYMHQNEVSMYGEMYSYAVSYCNLSAVLVLKERHNVNHPVKKVLLYTKIQLPSYIKINID